MSPRASWAARLAALTPPVQTRLGLHGTRCTLGDSPSRAMSATSKPGPIVGALDAAQTRVVTWTPVQGSLLSAVQHMSCRYAAACVKQIQNKKNNATSQSRPVMQPGCIAL